VLIGPAKRKNRQSKLGVIDCVIEIAYTVPDRQLITLLQKRRRCSPPFQFIHPSPPPVSATSQPTGRALAFASSSLLTQSSAVHVQVGIEVLVGLVVMPEVVRIIEIRKKD